MRLIYIFYEAESSCLLEKMISKELRKLNTWRLVNMLSRNVDKTGIIVFHPDNKPIKQKNTLI